MNDDKNPPTRLYFSLWSGATADTVPSLLLDDKLRIITANRAFSRLFPGHTSLAGLPVTRFFYDSLGEEAVGTIYRSVKSAEHRYSWSGRVEQKNTKGLAILANVFLLPLFRDDTDKGPPAGYVAIYDDISPLYHELISSTFTSLLGAARLKDNDTGNHIERVNRYARLLADAITDHPAFLEVDRQFVEDISVVAALADNKAELQRLWAASVDYRSDINTSRSIIANMEEPYRRFRNTFRYLLGNLADFDPEHHRVGLDQMGELDRWALSRLQAVVAEVLKAYEEYQFYRVYQRLYTFCTVDLSAFYLDVVKDRLYCEGKDSVGRRAAQTVLYELLEALVRLLAPILIHTCEEVWDHMPWREDLESIHLARFPELRPEWRDEALEARWKQLIAVRDEVARELEKLRAAKKIGSGLDARVTLYAEGELLELLRSAESVLPEAFIVSEVEVREGDSPDAVKGVDLPALGIVAEPSQRAKCVRCWRLLPSVGQVAEHPGLCERCARVVSQMSTNQGEEA